MRSFTISPLDDVGKALKQAGVVFEFGEFLKGETHYIVLTIKKAALLSHGVLKEDLGGAALLTRWVTRAMRSSPHLSWPRGMCPPHHVGDTWR